MVTINELTDCEKPKFIEARKIFTLIDQFLFVCKPLNEKDRKTFEKLCHYLIANVQLSRCEIKESECYIRLAFDQKLTVNWIHQVEKILLKCSSYLKLMKAESNSDQKSSMVYLNVLITFTSTNTWSIFRQTEDKSKYDSLRTVMNQICVNIVNMLVNNGLYLNVQFLLNTYLSRSKPLMSKAALRATLSLSMRPLVNSNYNHSSLSLFLVHILSVPGLSIHLSNQASDIVELISKQEIIVKSFSILSNEQNSRILFNALEGNYALCLVGNIIHFTYLNINSLNNYSIDFVVSPR